MASVTMFCKTVIVIFLMFEYCTPAEIGFTEWTVPLVTVGDKRFYFGIFFKGNWFKAQQYCRFHGMHLASIDSQEENDQLDQAIRNLSGYLSEGFWTSGTDFPENGTIPRKFFWMSNGLPFTFENWRSGEPNEKEEHCVELFILTPDLFKIDAKLAWNDASCDAQRYFICEMRTHGYLT